MQKFDYERASTILVEAAFYGDAEAAERAAISIRTIQRYRARLDLDDRLAQCVAVKKGQFESEWASELSGAIRTSIAFLRRAAKEANHKDPEVIHAIAGSLKILAEVGFTKAILDAKLGRFLDGDGEEDRAVGALDAGEADGGREGGL